MDKISKNKLGIDVIFKNSELFHGSLHILVLSPTITINFDSGFRFKWHKGPDDTDLYIDILIYQINSSRLW